jgi:hypothetical protein
MNNQYYVLYERDIETEKDKRYGAKMLYDSMTRYNEIDKAVRFGLSNLPALLFKVLPLTEQDLAIIKNKDMPYIVAAKFEGKYNHHDYAGECDPLISYDVIRCKQNDLENLVENFKKEKNIEKIITGIELNLYKYKIGGN